MCQSTLQKEYQPRMSAVNKGPSVAERRSRHARMALRRGRVDDKASERDALRYGWD